MENIEASPPQNLTDSNQNPTPTPEIKKKNPIILILITIIILMIIVFGVIKYFERKSQRSEHKFLLTQHQEDEQDSRTLLNLLNHYTLYETIEDDLRSNEDFFNTDSPNSYIEYSDPDKGLSFKVPYNSNWANEEFKITPYEKSSKCKGGMSECYLIELMHFGPFVVRDNGHWERNYLLKFYPNEIKDYIEMTDLGPIGENSYSEKFTISNLRVYEKDLYTSGRCLGKNILFEGKFCNYEFYIECFEDEDREIIKAMVSNGTFDKASCRKLESKDEIKDIDMFEVPKEQNPTFEHKLEGASPFSGGSILGSYDYNIEHQDKFYSEDAIRIITKEPLTEEESLDIEKVLPGVFCGMQFVSKEYAQLEYDEYKYEFCLTPLPKDSEELFSIIEKAKLFEEVVDATAYVEIKWEDLGPIAPAD